MNWNNNDTKYILKRFIIYILIAVAMFIIGTWKTHALTFNVDVQKNRDVTMSGGNMSYSFGLYPNNNSNYIQKSVLFTQDITCNTSMCALEFYNANTCTFETYDNMTGSTTMDVEITAINSELAMNYGYPNCTTNGNTISCLVNNNSRTIGLTLYFGTSKLDSGVTPSIVISSNCRGYIKDTYAIYDVPESVATAINQNTQAVQETNNTIKDSNVTTSDADDFTNNQEFSDSTGLESVIQLPLNMVNSLTSTCQPIHVTIPFINYTGEIPCMSTIYRSKFNALYTIVKLVINGFFVYRLLLKVYELVHNAKQPDEDKLEVIEL